MLLCYNSLVSKEANRNIDGLTTTALVIGLVAVYGIGHLNDRPAAPAGIYLPCVDPLKEIPCPTHEYEKLVPSATASLMSNPYLFNWRNGPLRETQVTILEYDNDHPPQTVIPQSIKLYTFPDVKLEEKGEVAEGEPISWRFEFLVGDERFALVDEYIEMLTIPATTYSEGHSRQFMNGQFLPLISDGKIVIDVDYSEVYIPQVTQWGLPRG